MKLDIQTARFGIFFSFCFLCLTFNFGCSATATSITLAPHGKAISYSQDFSRAYAARLSDGDWHVILIDDGITAREAHQSGEPLEPSPLSSIRQIVHLHIFWKPIPGTKGDNPSATNAAINWFVIGNSGGQQAEFVHYQGAGFVVIEAGPGEASITLHNGAVTLRQSRGNMADPLGPSSVAGAVQAVQSRARVEDGLEMIRRLSPEADDVLVPR